MHVLFSITHGIIPICESSDMTALKLLICFPEPSIYAVVHVSVTGLRAQGVQASPPAAQDGQGPARTQQGYREWGHRSQYVGLFSYN